SASIRAWCRTPARRSVASSSPGSDARAATRASRSTSRRSTSPSTSDAAPRLRLALSAPGVLRWVLEDPPLVRRELRMRHRDWRPVRAVARESVSGRGDELDVGAVARDAVQLERPVRHRERRGEVPEVRDRALGELDEAARDSKYWSRLLGPVVLAPEQRSQQAAV